MNHVEWKPVFIDGKLHPDLHMGDRVMIYEEPDKNFVGDKKTFIGIATLFHIPDLDYWEYDGLPGDNHPTIAVRFTKYWAEIPELPEGE